MANSDPQPVRHHARRLRWLGWLVLLAGLALLIVWGVRLAQAGLALRQHLRQVQALIAAPEPADPAAACDLVRALRSDVATLRGEAGWLVSLAPALGWLPRVGGDLRAAPHLLVVADGLTEAGALACDALEPALTASGEGSASLEQAVRLLASRHADLERALAAVQQAQVAWTQVNVDHLSPSLASKAAPLERGLPLLRAGLGLATVAPDLLGMNGPRTYLILALNEDELRPIAGYITGVGEVRVEAGRLVTMTFRDGYAVDDFTQPYPDPPEPLRRYMGIDLWVFRDSNWSPDFPTAARQAIALYRPGYPVTIDGVIALDQRAVQQLVEAIGPLAVEGSEGPVTGETVIAYIRRAWAPEDGVFTREWWARRKSFMGPLAEAAWQRIEQGQVDPIALARALLQVLDEKHLLIYLQDPAAEAVLAEPGWDGALRPGTGDFLMVVDANVGYNKASAKVQEAITYEVDLSRRPPRATLTLVYTHTATGNYPCVPEVRYDPVYEQMMDRCLWDYLRVYVPQGSRLLDATRIPVPGEALWSGQPESGEVTVRPAEEGPFLSLETLLLLPPGTVQTRSFIWESPESVITWEGNEGTYTLRLQKQPGTVGHPLRLRIRLPEGAVLVAADPPLSAVEGAVLIYETRLDRDRGFFLHFREE
jgi:hypothetical protein